MVLKKRKDFKKIDYNGSGRKINLVTTELELREKENGKYVFSAVAKIWNATSTDYICCGQCFDELCRFPVLKNNPEFGFIYTMWSKYHLNDIHAGTPKQELALRRKFGPKYKYNYDISKQYLESIGLFKDEGHEYGRGFYFLEIPEKDLNQLLTYFAL